MTRPADGSDPRPVPSLAELMSAYLDRQRTAMAQGLGPAPVGDVVPHEAVPAQPIDPRVAWMEALEVASHYGAAKGWSENAPPDWSSMVAEQEPAAAVPFCLGNYPQIVRLLAPLVSEPDLAKLRPMADTGPVSALVDDWAARVSKKGHAERLLAAAVCRLARRFDRTAQLLAEEPPAAWSGAWANERAALAWHSGRCDEAGAIWKSAPENVPVLFNRGLSALFSGRRAAARPALSAALEQIPDSSAWHHLGHLYLALAQM
jgi:hypothetical protein